MYKLLFVLFLFSSLNASQQTSAPLSSEEWSNFGNLNEEYVVGRQNHSEAVFDLLKEYADSSSQVLDLGCGTGISTRQLFNHGYRNTIGMDRDDQMLQQALLDNEQQITYLQGDVTKSLPFDNEKFDVVTAFSAIHWFSDPSSIQEVLRVLKPKGYYFIVGNGNENNKKGSLRDYANSLIEKAIGKPLPEKGVDAAALLEAQGFKIIYNHPIPSIKMYSKEQAVAYIKSRSYWNFVRGTSAEQEIIAQLEAYFDSHCNADGKLIQEGKTFVVLGQK